MRIVIGYKKGWNARTESATEDVQDVRPLHPSARGTHLLSYTATVRYRGRMAAGGAARAVTCSAPFGTGAASHGAMDVLTAEQWDALHVDDWSMVEDWIGTPRFTPAVRNTFFLTAVRHNCGAIVALLLQTGSVTDPDILTKGLHAATGVGSFTPLILLLQYGGDVNTMWYGETLLHSAMLSELDYRIHVADLTGYRLPGLTTTIQILLSFKPDTTITNTQGMTAYEFARYLKQDEIAAMIAAYESQRTESPST